MQDHFLIEHSAREEDSLTEGLQSEIEGMREYLRQLEQKERRFSASIHQVNNGEPSRPKQEGQPFQRRSSGKNSTRLNFAEGDKGQPYQKEKVSFFKDDRPPFKDNKKKRPSGDTLDDPLKPLLKKEETSWKCSFFGRVCFSVQRTVTTHYEIRGDLREKGLGTGEGRAAMPTWSGSFLLDLN